MAIQLKRQPFIKSALIALFYFIIARIGLLMSIGLTNDSPIWLPTGFALASVLLWGNVSCIGIFAGALIADSLTFTINGFPPATSFFCSLGISVGNTLEAFTGAYLIRKYIGSNNIFFKTRFIVTFIIFGAIIPAVISATIGVTGICLWNIARGGEFLYLWWVWWAGDVVGALTLAPFMLVWLQEKPGFSKSASFLKMTLIYSSLLLVLFSAFTFRDNLKLIQFHRLEYLTIPVIIWSVFQYGKKGATISLMLTCVITSFYTAKGYGPFIIAPHKDPLLLLQFYLSIVAITAFIFTAALEERETIRTKLKLSESRLSDLYENAPDMYASIDMRTMTILQCNDTLVKSLGYAEKEEITGRNISFIYHPDCMGKVHQWYSQFRETGEIRNAELQLRKKDGNRTEVSLSASAIRDVEGKIIRMRSIWRDITEYKYIESQIRKLAKFPDENPNPMLRISKDGIVLYSNKAGEVFLNTWKCKPNEPAPAEVNKTVSDVLATGTKKELEIVVNDRMILTTFAPVPNEGYVNLYGSDVTEREKALTSLKESQEQIQLLLNSTGEAIYGIDTHGICTFVNTSCLKLLGYDNSGQLIGKQMHYIIHYKHSDGRLMPMEECKIYRAYLLKQGTHVTDEVFWRADGSCFFAEYRSFPIFKGDDVIGTVVSFTDISERKQMEDKLQKLSLAVEQSVCSIVITDMEGTIQYVNPKFTDMTGYTYEEAIGHNPRILKSGKTPREEYKKLWDSITSGNSWQGEFYNKRKNDDYFWELAEISPIKDRNGNITNFLAIKEDITEKKREEKERAQLKEQLFHAQRLDSVGRLSGGIAHDFNNFLMAILGYTNLLQLMLQDNKLALSHLNNIHVATEKASRLTKNLLAFSKKQVIQLKSEDLNSIIQGIEPLIRQLLTVDINYIVNYTTDPLIVTADKLQIEQVLMNLATNAKDAMPEGGTFAIQTFSEKIDDAFIAANGFGLKGAYAGVSIRDTGTGMDEETKAKIFEPFFTTKEADKGTGLGLSTTYGIVKQHNGFIDVSTKKGEGTVFTLYFPISDIPLKDVVQTPASREALTKGSEAVLVADDDESVRFVFKEILEMFGYTVITASDGENAIHKYKENVDTLKLLILDVKMPKKDGKKVYDEVMLITPEIKIIFLSGYTDSILPQNIVQNKNVYFMQKPVLPTKLLKQVNDILK